MECLLDVEEDGTIVFALTNPAGFTRMRMERHPRSPLSTELVRTFEHLRAWVVDGARPTAYLKEDYGPTWKEVSERWDEYYKLLDAGR